MKFKWIPKYNSNANIAKWQAHVADCLALGTCIECDDRPLKGQQRCKAHAALNRARISAWTKENSRVKYEAYKAKGLCVQCGKHRDCNGARCSACRAVNRHRRRIRA